VDHKKKIIWRPPSDNPAPEHDSELRRRARRWCHFLRFIEHERRLRAGERLVRFVPDDDG